jgi:hypothetical protein
MSRATWYRHGKPATKPPARVTQPEAARLMEVSVRSAQRARRIGRYAPDLREKVLHGTLTMAAAERILVHRIERLRAGEITLAEAFPGLSDEE